MIWRFGYRCGAVIMALIGGLFIAVFEYAVPISFGVLALMVMK